MKCPNCGSWIESGWRYCPSCGNPIGRKGDFADISRLFAEIENELQKTMNDMMESSFEAFDTRPLFETKRKGRGFSIRITTKNGQRPDISIKTFGNIDPKEVQKWVTKSVKMIPEENSKDIDSNKKTALDDKKPPKVTEEPVTNVRRMGDSVVMELRMPEVVSEDNIEVRDLESSIEVRARAGDKLYFKILTKPENFKLVNYKFSDGYLFLELK
ncbi:MAG: zinc ribbon domain-containing protein [Candidatus Micrarchaeota archaeon]|nr:zinc ribbon domain-containing protein [Candidatus Micrarchaeota archaeon]